MSITLIKGETMKLLSFIAAAIFSVSAYAINDFVCQFETREGTGVTIEVERAIGNPRAGRRVEMSVQRDDNVQVYNYFATPRFDRAFKRITFQSAGMDLEINTWPDTWPRWGFDYRSNIRTWDIDEGVNYYQLNCRYVGIRK